MTFAYADRDRTDDSALNDDERLGFRLQGTTLQSLLGADNWQPLTDPAVLRVTGFRVAARVQSALSSLSPEHRAVVILHHLEGQSVEEIAATLRIAVGTVKSRLARARAELKRKLCRYVEE